MTEERKNGIQADKDAMAEVLKTAPGRRVMRLIHNICGYHAAERVVRADGGINLEATALNAERRLVCVQLRALMTRDDLKAVDYGTEEN